MTRAEAVARLTRRWQEQVTLFPTMRQELPLRLYITANVAMVQQHGLLCAYAVPPTSCAYCRGTNTSIR